MIGEYMTPEEALSEEQLRNVIEICRHMVGLDYKKPYHRHGKAFYVAYRNGFFAGPGGNEFLELLPACFLRSWKTFENGVGYSLTEQGLEWLGKQLDIKIRRS